MFNFFKSVFVLFKDLVCMIFYNIFMFIVTCGVLFMSLVIFVSTMYLISIVFHLIF